MSNRTIMQISKPKTGSKLTDRPKEFHQSELEISSKKKNTKGAKIVIPKISMYEKYNYDDLPF